MREKRKFTVIVERGPRNFSAYSPELPGCVAAGATEEETLAKMREAIAFHLDGLTEDRQRIPRSTVYSAHVLTI